MLQLKDLCGAHKLQGVEQKQVLRKAVEDWEEDEMRDGVAVRLDGITYLAVCDPRDGWRSCCEDLEIIEDVPRYRIPDIPVIGTMRPQDRWSRGTDDILMLIDAATGKSVLEIGTGNTGDWYPYWHFEYHPENLACNQQ